MKLLSNTWNGYTRLKWTKAEVVCYFLRRIAEKTKIAHPFFEERLRKARHQSVMRYFDPEERCFNFNGARIPDISHDPEKLDVLRHVYEDVLLFSCHYGENYHRHLVEKLDKSMVEGPYGYTDGAFDVTVKPGDIVIDAGAWIGDFSAYAASKRATSYAFEPTDSTYTWLCETARLNSPYIIPVKSGLGDKKEELQINICDQNSGSNSLVSEKFDIQRQVVYADRYETVQITTLDAFVEANDIKKIDYIKSDIEGFERNLLKGAQQTLKRLAPKLAICTYHFPDDPQVLESLILEANPNYTVVHLRHKLFAAAVKKQ